MRVDSYTTVYEQKHQFSKLLNTHVVTEFEQPEYILQNLLFTEPIFNDEIFTEKLKCYKSQGINFIAELNEVCIQKCVKLQTLFQIRQNYHSTAKESIIILTHKMDDKTDRSNLQGIFFCPLHMKCYSVFFFVTVNTIHK